MTLAIEVVLGAASLVVMVSVFMFALEAWKRSSRKRAITRSISGRDLRSQASDGSGFWSGWLGRR